MWGVFCKEMKWGVFFCKKKWAFPLQNETKLTLDLFFILHFTYLHSTQRTPPPAYGPAYSAFKHLLAEFKWRRKEQ